MVKYKPGDRVRILRFSEIDPGMAGGFLHEHDCYGIAASCIDSMADEREYYTVAYVGCYSLELEEDECRLAWLPCMLAPHEEESEEACTDEPDPLFTSLFGMDVEVWR